jgi:hypothetical protein
MAPSAAYEPAPPKPSTPASSSHHGRCGVRLVWASHVWGMSNRIKYTHCKSVRIFYYSDFIYSAPNLPDNVSLSVKKKTPVSLFTASATAVLLLLAASASFIVFNDSHSSSVKSRTAETAFLFCSAAYLLGRTGIWGQPGRGTLDGIHVECQDEALK